MHSDVVTVLDYLFSEQRISEFDRVLLLIDIFNFKRRFELWKVSIENQNNF